MIGTTVVDDVDVDDVDWLPIGNKPGNNEWKSVYLLHSSEMISFVVAVDDSLFIFDSCIKSFDKILLQECLLLFCIVEFIDEFVVGDDDENVVDNGGDEPIPDDDDVDVDDDVCDDNLLQLLLLPLYVIFDCCCWFEFELFKFDCWLINDDDEPIDCCCVIRWCLDEQYNSLWTWLNETKRKFKIFSL